MTTCLEADDLVALGSAVHWNVDEALEHLAGCEGCREQLRTLRAVYHQASEEIAPKAGFSDVVMQAIGERGRARSSAPFGSRVTGLLTPALAGMTAFFAIALLSAGETARLTGIPVLVVCGAAALGALWWSRFSMSTVPPT
ncbi:MAG: hypothetical protein O7I93_05740 [Gemmatimonadetes bacterium]|nr:hypothetical protein [Gemmatimonadota bacterium]